MPKWATKTFKFLAKKNAGFMNSTPDLIPVLTSIETSKISAIKFIFCQALRPQQILFKKDHLCQPLNPGSYPIM